MISKSLSTSKKFAAAGRAELIGEFAQLLYTLLQPHCDDFGRQEGDPFTVKLRVLPTSSRSEQTFAAALTVLRDTGLIRWYPTEAGQEVIEIVGFEQHQHLYRKAASDFPSSISGPGSLNASERDIEAFIERELTDARLTFDDLRIVNIARQVRQGNRYLDLLAHTAEGVSILIEVKRQRITTAAIAQVLAYADRLEGEVLPVVVGHGLAAGLDVSKSRAMLVVYNDSLLMRQLTFVTVNSRSVTLRHVQSELNGRELNRREEKVPPQPPRKRRGSKPPIKGIPPDYEAGRAYVKARQRDRDTREAKK